MLETLHLNIPSIIILDKKYTFSKISNKIFMDLKKNNIFFDDPIMASKFVNKIWNEDVKLWWFSNRVQNSIKKFNLNFSKSRANVISDLKKIFGKLMKIIGIHDGHDCSVALMVNGKIVYAAQEERFSRLKGDYGFPKKQLKICLNFHA